MQINNTETGIKANVGNLFFNRQITIDTKDLVDIFQYSINTGLVQVVKRKGISTVKKKEKE